MVWQPPVELGSYIPEDRLQALATGKALPPRTSGTALIADVAGFTALTETLRARFGARRGADEVTQQLNALYTVLIDEVERRGGAVIGFAGDGITCWFDDREGAAAMRAVSCGAAMQRTMQPSGAVGVPTEGVSAVGLKVALATGEASRFVVGDSVRQVFDVLAGPAVRRSAAGEKLARRGEMLLDHATLEAVRDQVNVEEWREYSATGDRFAVLGTLLLETPVGSPFKPPALDEQLLRPWIHPAVLERAQGAAGLSSEYRPCVVVFVGFTAPDDALAECFGTLLQSLQTVAQRYGGLVMAPTVDEAGGYAHVNFGATAAHEDDARRALRLALELRAAPGPRGATLKFGIAQGVMRVGPFGSPTRWTFGDLGDDVNLAARLMQSAEPGEVLVSTPVQRATSGHFDAEPRAPVTMRGKGEPLPVFAVIGERRLRPIRLQEPVYSLPMIGRATELRNVTDLIETSRTSGARIIALSGEVGIGKSRLLAEAIRAARRRGFVGYGGACQSDGAATPYLPWKPIWSAFFNVDPDKPLRRQVVALRAELEERAPHRVEALPLLGQLLDLDVPDNDFTRGLEPRLRQSALHALLEDTLAAAASVEPILIVIEDLHWIDAVSLNLLEQLTRAVARLPVCFVLAFRPSLGDAQLSRLAASPVFTGIQLAALDRAEFTQAIRAKLVQLYPAREAAVSDELVDRLYGRAQGNPYFLEELLNYLRDRGLDPRNSADIAQMELPDNLHAMVLSRIDQLDPREQITLRIASIIGRLFRARWIAGYYPEIGEPSQLKDSLNTLDSLDITLLDSVEPDPSYLFKHIVTHEVTYESLPFATRERLHERLAQYLESAYGDAPPVELLAFHYGRSGNRDKRSEYLRRAGEAAQRAFANDSALAYYGELLSLLDDAAQMAEVHLQRCKVLELTGRYTDAERDALAALELSLGIGHVGWAAQSHLMLGRLCRLRGELAAALEWLEKARSSAQRDQATVALETGLVYHRLGEYARARACLNEGSAAAEANGDRHVAATALNYLGLLAASQGDNVAAEVLHRRARDARRELGDTAGLSWSLNNLGNVALDLGRHAEARALFEESLKLKRAMGDRSGVGGVLNNLGLVALVQGELGQARELFEQALAVMREVGDRYVIASLLGNLAKVLTDQGDADAARPLFDESLGLSREMGDKWGVAASLCSLGLGAIEADDTSMARHCLEECLELCRAMEERPLAASALLGLALLQMTRADGRVESAAPLLAESLSMRQAMGEPLPLTSSLIGAAMLVLRRGDAAAAARLLGAVNSALRAIGAPVEAEMRNFYARARAEAAHTMGDAAFEAEWAVGAQWPLGEAVRFGLEAARAGVVD